MAVTSKRLELESICYHFQALEKLTAVVKNKCRTKRCSHPKHMVAKQALEKLTILLNKKVVKNAAIIQNMLWQKFTTDTKIADSFKKKYKI